LALKKDVRDDFHMIKRFHVCSCTFIFLDRGGILVSLVVSTVYAVHIGLALCKADIDNIHGRHGLLVADGDSDVDGAGAVVHHADSQMAGVGAGILLDHLPSHPLQRVVDEMVDTGWIAK
jgi:hypothetical protein